jgi:hypothetical protein
MLRPEVSLPWVAALERMEALLPTVLLPEPAEGCKAARAMWATSAGLQVEVPRCESVPKRDPRRFLGKGWPENLSGAGRAARWSPFKWVNTTLGNVKAAIVGTYRRISPEHAGRHLGSFAWRYNRRFQLDSLIPRLVHSAARTAPLPYATLIAS